MSDELWRWGAARIATAIRTGEITSVDAVEAVLSRIAETNEATLAFGSIADDAVERAQLADAAVDRGDELGVLHGIPFASKLNTDVAGQPTPDGIEARLNSPPAREHSPVHSNLLRAGAVHVGRTNCPPFSTRFTTESNHWGITRNPWARDTTAGGSSGGAAAAVATGAVPLAQGNDSGGSIRQPAAVCGVVGLRTTPGRIPYWHGGPDEGPSLTTQLLATEGPIARKVEDLRLALEAMSAVDARDPTSVTVPAPSRLRPAPRRIALIVDPGNTAFSYAASSECAHATREAGEWFADDGYDIEEFALPELGELATVFWRLKLTELRALGTLDEIQQAEDEGIRAYVGNIAHACDQAFGNITLAGFAQDHKYRYYLVRRISEFMERYPLLLLPISCEPAFRLGEDIRSVEATSRLMAGMWPCTSIPASGLPGVGIGVRATDGAPLGVQVVGRRFDEELTLDGAEVIERRNELITPFDPFEPMRVSTCRYM